MRDNKGILSKTPAPPWIMSTRGKIIVDFRKVLLYDRLRMGIRIVAKKLKLRTQSRKYRRTCDYCGDEFFARQHNQYACSPLCADMQRRTGNKSWSLPQAMEPEMNLYNCKHADGGYRLTKFTKDYEVESSYVVSAEGCDCPAGIRPVCRHRTMLPFFLEHDHVDDGWFFIWDTRQWLPPIRPQGAPSTSFPQTETTTIEYGIEQHVTSDEPSQSCGDAVQPAPPTVKTPIAPQTPPASAEGAGFRFRRPNL